MGGEEGGGKGKEEEEDEEEEEKEEMLLAPLNMPLTVNDWQMQKGLKTAREFCAEKHRMALQHKTFILFISPDGCSCRFFLFSPICLFWLSESCLCPHLPPSFASQ